MFIFIDESGTFVIPQAGQRSLCCVGALVVPESRHDAPLEGLRGAKHAMVRLPTTDLIKKVIDQAAMEFAIKDPPEAGKFRWVIDGKDEKKTEYEAAWELMAGGFNQRIAERSIGTRLYANES